MKSVGIFFIFVLISLVSHSQSLSEGLLLHYSFSGNANDNSENSFDGTVYGASLTTDRFGIPNSAYYFDGVDDFIELPNSNILKPDLPVSISMYVKYEDLGADNCVLFNTSFEDNRSCGVYANIQNSTKKYSVGYGDGTYGYGPNYRRSYNSNSIIDTTSWQFVVFVIEDAQNMQVFVNCHEFAGEFSGFGNTLVYSDSAGSIGRHDQDMHLEPYYFKGKIDEFTYWDRALNYNDIDSLCECNSVYDTIFVYDTIPIYDTILVYDTIPFYDTIVEVIYDSIAVTDTLIIKVELNNFLSNVIKVYPNPAKDRVYINTGSNYLEMSDYTLRIVNQQGEKIFETEFNIREYVLDVSDFIEKGLFFVQVIDPGGNVIDVRKILLY